MRVAVARGGAEDFGMGQEPRRRRFQFHLSTGIVLMLVSAGILYLNLRVSNENSQVPKPQYDAPAGDRPWFTRIARMGWPYGFLIRTNDLAYPEEWASRPINVYEFFNDDISTRSFELTPFLDDLFIAVLILGLAFGAWEGVLRVWAFFAEQAEEIESGG